MPVLDDLSKGIEKGLEEAKKGLKVVGEKASEAAKTLEIQQDIRKLEGNIRDIKLQIGEKAVELAGKGVKLDPAIDELTGKISEIQTQIESKRAEIEALKQD